MSEANTTLALSIAAIARVSLQILGRGDRALKTICDIITIADCHNFLTMAHQILFLCTGNYYRSRFSEYLFNALAEEKELDWRADSRGLALERGVFNIGAISFIAALNLKQRGIILPENLRFPQSLQEEDLKQSDRIIAVDESEHRPLMAERFPAWENKIEYWSVHDIDQTPPNSALDSLEQQIYRLIETI
ncbi:MAG: low molecular weight phosphatase family protein [Cyanobacteria bacterium P01_E01_bin.42]